VDTAVRAGVPSPHVPRAQAALRCYVVGVSVLLLLGVVQSGVVRTVAWSAAGILAVLALVIGPLLGGAERLRAWWLLALAGLLLMGGNYVVLADTTMGYVTVPSTVDFIACGAYPLAAVAVLIIAMRGSPLMLWARLLDTLIVLTGLSLFTWTLLVVPLAGSSMPSTAVRVFAVTYALGDAFILVILGRMLYPQPRLAGAAVWLLLGGTCAMLAADVLFSLLELGAVRYTHHSAPGIAQTVVWLGGFAAWGAAALSPSAASIVRPAPVPGRTTAPPHRTVLLSGAALAPAVAVSISALAHQRIQGETIAIFGTVIALLLVARLNVTLAQADARLRAQRVLGAAADRLVAANETGEILATVLDSAQALAGRGDPDIAAAAIDGDTLLAVANDEASAEPSVRSAQPAEPAEWITEHLAGRPHVTFGDTAAPDRPAAFALGVTVGPTGLGERIEPLRILATQASQARSRLGLSREISRRDGEAYFRALVDDASDAIVIIEQSGHVRYASPSAAVLFQAGAPTEAGLGALFGRRNAEWILQALAEPPGEGGAAVRMDWHLDRPGMGRLELEVACSDLREVPAVHGLVLTLRDVTAQRRLERDLRHHAYHDRLTGMGNRLKFTRRVELAMATAKVGGPVPTVVLMDIDGFRELNEVHGREFGDLVLITLGSRLAQAPGVLEAARFDSDSFATLVETPDGSPAAGLEAAERLAAVVARSFELPAGQVNLTACAGVASAAEETRSEDVIRDARLALEAAKVSGRDSRRSYAARMLRARLEHAELHRDLETAIADGALMLHYQPVVALATGAIAAFEALVRWPHPERGMIPPDRFIPLAEETGLIVRLGQWIIRRAARDAAALRAEPDGDEVRVAVNVSARQLAVPGLAALITGALEDAKVGPDALIVELTESTLIRRGEEGDAAPLKSLRELGIGLAIDDFGTGYSSLSYLHDLPFDALKIDKSFVHEITDSARRMELVRGIIGIADALGLYVVAEGVERPEQRDLLVEAGCTYGQGYLFSRPVPLEEAKALLRRRGGATRVPGITGTPGTSGTPGSPGTPGTPGTPGRTGGPGGPFGLSDET